MIRSSFLTNLGIVLATVTACSSSTTTTGLGTNPDASASSSSGAATSPCGPNGPYGTFTISGELGGSESICGLSLGSFSNATLTVSEAGTGATVTVAHSAEGHIDVNACAATVAGCEITATDCAGSTDPGSTITLSFTVGSTGLSEGQSSIGTNGCRAPGLEFTGTR